MRTHEMRADGVFRAGRRLVLKGLGCACGLRVGSIGAAVIDSTRAKKEASNDYPGKKKSYRRRRAGRCRQALRAWKRADLKVLSAEAVTWSDGSLGCPEPGMMYTQALVPGYRVQIRGGRTGIWIITLGREGVAGAVSAGAGRSPRLFRRGRAASENGWGRLEKKTTRGLLPGAWST